MGGRKVHAVRRVWAGVELDDQLLFAAVGDVVGDDTWLDVFSGVWVGLYHSFQVSDVVVVDTHDAIYNIVL